uniref:Uncharacterized protein n=1 Tax=Roseihalotalea indica TaxID=2867963 RepID=A0AA49GQ91_9BACT|nr:hypothetical protein K4G66_07375 [Tunicatimonas sp. TK19036]
MRRRYTAQHIVRLIQRSYAQGWEEAVKQYDEVQSDVSYRKLRPALRKKAI